MKKIWMVALVAALGIALLSPGLRAQDEEAKTEGQVTQAELASLLVDVLGLSVTLPPNPTFKQTSAALLANKIFPAEGWKASEVVTRATLARVVVQAMGKAGEVENPEDPKAWIDYLKGTGVAIDTVGQAVDNVGPMGEPVLSNPAFTSTTDPLKTVKRVSNPDETQFGTDLAPPDPGYGQVAVVEEVIKAVIKEVTKRRKVTSSVVTPDEPIGPPVLRPLPGQLPS